MSPEGSTKLPRLAAPKALLLDCGGVIIEGTHVKGWRRRLAEQVFAQLKAEDATAFGLTVEAIDDDIDAGCIADSHWKKGMSRTYAPPELTYEQFWGDFVAADWPKGAQAVVLADAKELCRKMGHFKSKRSPRNGIVALLDRCAAAKIPVAIVSNALNGQVHRDVLQEMGLFNRFVLDVHSDDARVRKPNPEMILIATRHLKVDPADTWYVGDNIDRDVLCGRRAGVGSCIHMLANSTEDPPYEVKVSPDAIVADPAGLLVLLEKALSEVPAR
jgi:N-acetyl-D-muramate 6-phosphate phosphatase